MHAETFCKLRISSSDAHIVGKNKLKEVIAIHKNKLKEKHHLQEAANGVCGEDGEHACMCKLLLIRESRAVDRKIWFYMAHAYVYVDRLSVADGMERCIYNIIHRVYIYIHY
jgi:hypothetical protein